MILVVDQQNTVLRYSANNLRIECGSKPPRRVPVRQIEQVVVYGNVLVESAAMRALASAAVPTIFWPGRGRSEPALVGGGLATQLPLRQAQHQCAANPLARVELARWFIEQKIMSYQLPINALKQTAQLTAQAEDRFLTQRENAAVQLQSAETVAAIMGVEGSLANAWFALLANVLPPRFKFSGRNRRPPADPVNALLSLGYTLVLSDLRESLMTAGFDQSLGFLHSHSPGRESLVLDFAELFRAAVDNFVIHWIISPEVDEASFYFREKEGCRLSKTARPGFYQSWASYREHWPRPVVYDSDVANWPTGYLRELINGQVARFRQVLQSHEGLRK
ncbi:MAG: CRISPR-associated endonuclease Cas1 [Thiotrichales bacterium]